MSVKDLIARLEAAIEGSRELDLIVDRWARDNNLPHISRAMLSYTTSLDAARSLGGMLVYASEIGADGLPMVKLVFDTSTSPVIEYTGIAATLELAWCIAALKEWQDGGE